MNIDRVMTCKPVLINLMSVAAVIYNGFSAVNISGPGSRAVLAVTPVAAERVAVATALPGIGFE